MGIQAVRLTDAATPERRKPAAAQLRRVQGRAQKSCRPYLVSPLSAQHLDEQRELGAAGKPPALSRRATSMDRQPPNPSQIGLPQPQPCQSSGAQHKRIRAPPSKPSEHATSEAARATRELRRQRPSACTQAIPRAFGVCFCGALRSLFVLLFNHNLPFPSPLFYAEQERPRYRP